MPLLITALLSCESAEKMISRIPLSIEGKSELIQVIQENTEKGCVWDAKADCRNGPNPPYLWRKPMAKVTYRGVEYDTEEYNAKVLAEAAQRNRHDLMYRGLKVKSGAVPCS